MKQPLNFNQIDRLFGEVHFKNPGLMEIKSATYDTDTNQIEFVCGLVNGMSEVEMSIPLSDSTIDYVLNGIKLTRD